MSNRFALGTLATLAVLLNERLAGLTLKEIRDMAAEMLDAEKQWLPQFEPADRG